jgi:hypothetical protein
LNDDQFLRAVAWAPKNRGPYLLSKRGNFYFFIFYTQPTAITPYPICRTIRPTTTSSNHHQIVGSHSQLGRLLPPNTPVRLEGDGQFYQGSYTTLTKSPELDSHPTIRGLRRLHRSPWLSLHHARPWRRCIGCLRRRSREEDSRTSRCFPIKEEKEFVGISGLCFGAKTILAV